MHSFFLESLSLYFLAINASERRCRTCAKPAQNENVFYTFVIQYLASLGVELPFGEDREYGACFIKKCVSRCVLERCETR
jgi:hypothetical protein